MEYGCRKEILNRNKAEALWEQVEYDVEITELPLLQTQLSQTQTERSQLYPAEGEQEFNDERVFITIYNQYGMPLRLSLIHIYVFLKKAGTLRILGQSAE